MENDMNRYKLIIKSLSTLTLAVMILLGFSTTTMAQNDSTTFTFSSKNNPINNLGGDGQNGVPYSAGHWTGNSKVSSSDGKKTDSSYSCVMMTQPPNDSLFQLHVLCDIKTKDGAYSATMGCTFIDVASSEVSCIGGLYGTGGVYSGRRGSITNYGKNNTASGTGQWYK